MIDDLFEEGEAIEPPAGEMMFEGVTHEMLQEEETKLSNLAKTLLDTWKEKQKQPALDVAVCELLGKVYGNSDLGLSEDTRRTDKTDQMVTAYFQNKIQAVLDELPEYQVRDFVMYELVFGMRTFNTYWRRLQERDPRKILEMHLVYEGWFKEKVLVEGRVGELNKPFSRFLENLMIRSGSEAFCETVGSIMNNKVSNGSIFFFLNKTLFCLF